MDKLLIQSYNLFKQRMDSFIAEDEISDESNIYGVFWDTYTQLDNGPATESNSFDGVVGIEANKLLLAFCEFCRVENKNFDLKGLTYPKLARRIRGVRDLKSTKIGARRTTIIVGRSLTPFAKSLIDSARNTSNASQ